MDIKSDTYQMISNNNASKDKIALNNNGKI